MMKWELNWTDQIEAINSSKPRHHKREPEQMTFRAIGVTVCIVRGFQVLSFEILVSIRADMKDCLYILCLNIKNRTNSEKALGISFRQEGTRP
jgi:hypothetical protein